MDLLYDPTSIPTPDVAFAWGSISIRRVGVSVTAKYAEILTAEVVLPTPPLPPNNNKRAMAMGEITPSSACRCIA